MINVGVRSHLVAARHASPLLIGRSGLAVLTGYTDPAAEVIGNHVFYDLAMTAVSRLAPTLAHDLRPYGVTALALSPGLPVPRRSSPRSATSCRQAPTRCSFLAAPYVPCSRTQVWRRAPGAPSPSPSLASKYGFTDIGEQQTSADVRRHAAHDEFSGATGDRIIR